MELNGRLYIYIKVCLKLYKARVKYYLRIYVL